MRPIIYPYKLGSNSARALCNSLRDVRAKRVRGDGNYHPFPNHLIVNWGNPRVPNWHTLPFRGAGILNNYTAVIRAQNKLETYQLLQGHVQIPEFTIDHQIATNWFNSGVPVLRRTVLYGHGGIGIDFCDPNVTDYAFEDEPVAPLYVKYEKKKHEYRVHVFRNNVIDVQQKKKRNDVEEVNYQIRNYNNGWVFCRDGVNPPEQVVEQARLAVTTLGLDFGAVDVGWNEKNRRAVVFEVNTAPGLEGTTLLKYTNAIRELL